jgi:hypothetical protein
MIATGIFVRVAIQVYGFGYLGHFGPPCFGFCMVRP